MNILDAKLQAAALGVFTRRSHKVFLERSIATLNPGAPFLHNWHIDAILYHLELVRLGKIKRLIINLPPRSLKSIISSVSFPAYILGHDPKRRIFCISYSAELAEKLALDARSVMDSRWYCQAFPKLRISRMADSDIYTTDKGFRKATSINATLTGLGGDLFIIDDPLKPQDAMSDSIRTRLNVWFSNTLLSRLDDKTKGAIIVVMQRVHLDDLTGHLLENSSGWTVLSLPAIAEEDAEILIGHNTYHFRRKGDLLHPEREPKPVLDNLRREMGPDPFSAQFQQSPVPPGGGIIKRAWLRYYDHTPDLRFPGRVLQSWDTAAKDGVNNDYSVCTTWLLLNGIYYLLDVTRGQYDYPTLRATAINLARRYKPGFILIEDASAGIALAQELKREGISAVRPIKVDRDKTTRLFVQQAKFESGQVLFPKGASFLPDLEAELLTFPQARHDDIVDSITQALAYKFGYDSTLSWVGG